MEALADQLRLHSTPLETIAPEDELDDLEFLADELAGKRLIGMGESTHGTREFFRFRHRLLRFMVEELGLRVFAWEDNFSATVALDRYVRTGEGDPLDTLNFSTDIYFPWLTESVVEMIEWMREFNRGRDPDDKLRFYGFDMESGRTAIAELERFFELADDEFLRDHEDAVEVLTEDPREVIIGPRTREVIETIDDFPAALHSHLDANEADYRETVGSEEYAFAKQHGRIIEQYLEYAPKVSDSLDGGEVESHASVNHRDRAMAENIEWVLDHEDGEQVALWAHNVHLQKSPESVEGYDGEQIVTGVHLDDWYGDEYYCLGQEFGHGVVRVGWGPRAGRNTQRHESPPAETVPGLLSKLGEPYTFVDIATAMNDEPLAEWLSDRQELSRIGWGPTRDRLVEQAPVGESFDALIFVEEGSETNDIEALRSDFSG